MALISHPKPIWYRKDEHVHRFPDYSTNCSLCGDPVSIREVDTCDHYFIVDDHTEEMCVWCGLCKGTAYVNAYREPTQKHQYRPYDDIKYYKKVIGILTGSNYWKDFICSRIAKELYDRYHDLEEPNWYKISVELKRERWGQFLSYIPQVCDKRFHLPLQVYQNFILARNNKVGVRQYNLNPWYIVWKTFEDMGLDNRWIPLKSTKATKAKNLVQWSTMLHRELPVPFKKKVRKTRKKQKPVPFKYSYKPYEPDEDVPFNPFLLLSNVRTEDEFPFYPIPNKCDVQTY